MLLGSSQNLQLVLGLPPGTTVVYHRFVARLRPELLRADHLRMNALSHLQSSNKPKFPR